MSKRVAIIQSNYLPWKGYFDIINMVDLFIFYDDVQYTKNDWRNRNRIKTPKGPTWLTVPCGPGENRLIREVEIGDSTWQRKHWETLRHCYGKAKHFKDYEELFKEIYLGREWNNLSELNQCTTALICHKILGIETALDDSRRYGLTRQKGERVIELLKETKATEYLSGPAARAYLDEARFREENIKLTWMDYSGYPEYNQLYPPFDHNVSIVDLIFNEGPDATKYMLSF